MSTERFFPNSPRCMAAAVPRPSQPLATPARSKCNSQAQSTSPASPSPSTSATSKFPHPNNCLRPHLFPLLLNPLLRNLHRNPQLLREKRNPPFLQHPA